MEEICKHDVCTGCGACASSCPADAIRMEPDQEGFFYPVIHEDSCIHCNKCRRVCPVIHAEPYAEVMPQAYAAMNKDEQIRYDSTSGGIFSLIGQWAIESGGVVFGACYDENYTVKHCRIDCIDDLWKLRGAKYSQSQLGKTFQDTRSLLEEGRYVVFSGTPCQIEGLISFLGKPYEKLLLVDLICHGVPSPKVWKHYVDYRREKDAAGLLPVAVNLRSKVTGWPGYSARFAYPEGQVYSTPGSQDPFLRGFVNDIYLRHSCYNCKCKGASRRSDITLADYWGVWDLYPDYHDGGGTSLVLVHTKKAKNLWQRLSQDMHAVEVQLHTALADNPSALVSAELRDKRMQFFSCFETEDFSELVERLCPPRPTKKKVSFPAKVCRKICRVLRQIWKGRKQ